MHSVFVAKYYIIYIYIYIRYSEKVMTDSVKTQLGTG